MSENAPISFLSKEAVQARVEAGLIVAMDAGPGLQEVDCADKRPVTEAVKIARYSGYGEHIIPGRFLGGSVGVGAITFAAIGAQDGYEELRSVRKELDVDPVAEMAAEISTNA